MQAETYTIWEERNGVEKIMACEKIMLSLHLSE